MSIEYWRVFIEHEGNLHVTWSLRISVVKREQFQSIDLEVFPKGHWYSLRIPVVESERFQMLPTRLPLVESEQCQCSRYGRLDSLSEQ